MHSPFNVPRLALDKSRRMRTTFTVSPKAAQIARKCRFHGVRTVKSTQITKDVFSPAVLVDTIKYRLFIKLNAQLTTHLRDESFKSN